MEKIKNILTGNKHDDTTATSDQTTGNTGLHSGTGQTSGLTSGTTGNQSLTGEGSHLAGNRDNLGSSNTSGYGSNTSGAFPQDSASNTSSTGAGYGTQNTSSSGLGNTQNTGLSSGAAGPHTSNLANKADPRVDSDLDGARTVGNTGGVGNTTSTGNTVGNTSSTGTNYGSSTTNPTSSGAGYGTSTGNAVGNTSSTGTSYGPSTGSTTRSDNTGHSGPHKTEAANRLDPAVNTSGAIGLENAAHHHSANHGGGAEEADRHHGGHGGVVGGTTASTGLGQSSGVYDNTTGSTGHQSSHLGRDAAVGAGGVGLAEHEHHKHQNERSTGIGSSTGTSTGAYDNTISSTGHQSSHLGRDAAVVGGGAGLAEHEYHKHQNERGTGIGSSSTGAYGNTTGSSTTGTGNTSTDPAHPHSSHLANVDPHVDPNMDGSRGLTSVPYTAGAGQSRLGSDAAVGAAGVGAASSYPGPAPNTAGPHAADWLNKLDPRVDATAAQPQSTGHGPLKVTEGQTGTSNTTHHGRDAAALGAVGGAGVYEAEKHHHGTESGVGGTSSSTTAGPHSSNVANKADPIVDSDSSKDHHYGRDAGIAGGVGAGAYEADKHYQKHDKDLTASEREAKKEHKHELKEEKKEHKRELKEEKKEEKAEHKEKKGGLLSFLHRDKNKKYTKEEEDDFDRQEREHNSHKRRDAALGGAAVGGAAYEADKHHRDHQHTPGVEGDTNKPLPTAPGNHGIGTGAGTQNALAGDNTTSTSSGHHLGRDAAAVGGAGALGEHEHHKHSGATGTSGLNATPLDQKPRGTDLGDKLHGVDRNRGVQGSSGFPDSQGYGTGSSTTGTTSTGQHHYGRDATAVGGAAALGEHEHHKHEGATGLNATPLDQKPRGTDLGDKLHGVERNRGVQGSSGFPDTQDYGTGSTTGTTSSTGQHHYGRDATAVGGAAALGEHEHRKHENVNSSNQSSGLTSSTGTGNQHLGRDAAIGAGGVGLAEHEHRKHENTTGSGYDNTSSVTAPHQPHIPNHGRPVGDYYTSKDDSGTGYNNVAYDSNQTGGVASGFDTKAGAERNRLHKDPPINHPAAQSQGAHVPASGKEREKLIGEGEQSLDSNTGVAHAHGQSGGSVSNY